MIIKTLHNASHNQAICPQDRHSLDPIDNATVDLTDGVLTHALKDARQAKDGLLQQEALAWLWVCCPDIADELGLPTPQTKEIQPDITGYLQRYSAFSLA